MKPVELKVARIGNSRGVRLPAATLERYHIADSVIMEERADGILLRPRGQADRKLSWEDTAHDMSAHPDDWTASDAVAADGLEATPWDARPGRRVAEESPASRKGRRKSRSTKP